jgi:hypothetical protein
VLQGASSHLLPKIRILQQPAEGIRPGVHVVMRNQETGLAVEH